MWFINAYENVRFMLNSNIYTIMLDNNHVNLLWILRKETCVACL